MTRWYQEKKHEHFYREAKRVGYRARSAFKLKQINKRFGILSKNSIVLDLGAAPGGWCQVVQEIIGNKGKIIGVDILTIKPIDGVKFIQGDITDYEILRKINKELNDSPVDVVLSDLSPDISGNYSIDQARSLWLCESALEIALKLLKTDGTFLCKIFEGPDLKEFLDKINKSFSFVRKFSPDASRKRSSEIYIIAKSLKNNLS